jgi:hypothetical protein
LLKVGHLSFRRGKLKYYHVYCFHDLANNVQQNCVFGVGPFSFENISPETIIEDLQHYKNEWKIMANSFSEWLELVAKSKGAFGYVT